MQKQKYSIKCVKATTGLNYICCSSLQKEDEVESRLLDLGFLINYKDLDEGEEYIATQSRRS